MKEIQKVMYIVIDKRGKADVSTLRYKKEDSILSFLSQTLFGWKQAKKLGWECKRVDVLIRSTMYNDDY